MMNTIEEIKKELVQRLRHIDPKQIIIFGSYAHGLADEESDVDVYVVTKDKFMPRSYQEKRKLVRKVSRPLNELRQQMAIDLLVHTEAMNERFYALNSSFARDIQESGIQLL